MSDAEAPGDPSALALTTDWPSDAVCVVSLVGALDGTTAPRLADHLREQTAAGCRDLVLDVAGVRFLAAAGVTVLVNAQRNRLGIRGSLHLTGVTGNRPVEKVLALTDVLEVVDVHGDLGALLARLDG
ncbi:STAS domain-containing protein [Pseudonocardia humida]|uniref:STAS domain-containing protein n=1 Tax=Pseudonocardia humida TaxID=2800819 RepID=A0ABT1A061_9PSEU|nr:STAS domain-containing protein [Pseudonocardia humida]MCO1656264.1 STAS domain-containing protein [Pseudonocardia humida]